MAKNVIDIQNSTIVTGTTSTRDFLVVNINDKNVGIPLFTFEDPSPLDFVDLLQLDFVVDDATIMSDATSYGAGIALYVNGSACAFPIFKLDQTDVVNDVLVSFPTIVSQLTSWGQFVCLQVNNKAYAVPLFDYGTVFPFTTSAPMSSIPAQTKISKNTKNVGSELKPSTNLNSKIKTYKHLIKRITAQLGAPFINLEVCEDAQMVEFIDKALEWYTKYAGYTEEFLIFNSTYYQEPGLPVDILFTITPNMRRVMATQKPYPVHPPTSPDNNAAPLYSQNSTGTVAFNTLSYNNLNGWDYDLGDYRKVIGVFSFDQGESTGVNTLFTLEQAMAQQTYFSYMLGNAGFDLVTWEVMKGWLKLREKVLAQIPYIDFDNRTQLLRIIPAPRLGQTYVGCVGAWVEKPVADLIMERWVEAYAMALTKIAIGNVRGKYQGMQMFGGGVINYNDLLSQGLKEKDELEKEIQTGYGEVTPARFFIG